MPSPVAEVLHAVADALEGVGEGWYLMGAQAALLRGSRRITSDVDITLLPGSVSTATVIDRLAAAGLSLRVPDVDAFVNQTRVLPLLHDATGMPVDAILGGPGLEQLFLDAAEAVDIDGRAIPVATADHLVTMKLLAGRDKDLEDAAAIARATGSDLQAVAELVDAIAEGLGEDDIRRNLDALRRRLDGA